jgi:uncharacterized protein YyaL (SSP411 family)
MTNNNVVHNRLINEKSPYLLQHAHNPVDWFPWGQEAFEKAKNEDKPILLSIGYSTCYWCHRMAREAFNNKKIADFLNEHFVSIKVDREERPDIDTVYMEAAMKLTENVGWPLNIFLTSDKKPFFAGTYFPEEVMEGHVDFLTLLKSINKSYTTNKKFIIESAELLVEELQEDNVKREKIKEDILTNAIFIMKSTFDNINGGFGEAPKFLIAQQMFFLLRYWYLYREEYVLYMVEKTLDNIAKSEIYDNESGGFYRYALNKDWSGPHYEKMLYTNALMSMAYLEAYEVMHKNKHKEVVIQTLAYMKKKLLSPEGGFYSAEDSESKGAEKENKEPFIDKKISASLNGLAIACFAMSGKAFESKEYIDIAENCANFIFESLYKEDGKLNSYYIQGKSSTSGYAIDYIYMVWGLIELYQATYNDDYLRKAEKLNNKVIEDFWDSKKPGIFLYSKDSEELIINPKEIYDGAIPSTNSVCIMNFMKLSRLTKNYKLSNMAKDMLEEFGGAINKVPTDYLYHLCGYLYGRTPKEIIVSENKEEILDKLNGEFRPFTLEVLEDTTNSQNIGY